MGCKENQQSYLTTRDITQQPLNYKSSTNLEHKTSNKRAYTSSKVENVAPKQEFKEYDFNRQLFIISPKGSRANLMLKDEIMPSKRKYKSK